MDVTQGVCRGARSRATAVMSGSCLLALALAGCEYQPDRSQLESKVEQMEQGAFSTCIHESYRAGVELEIARAKLRELQAGSPSDTVLREGMAAVEKAEAIQARAKEACLAEQQADEAKARAMESQLETLNRRLAELEAAQTATTQEILVGVTFPTGSAELSREAKAVLDVQADRLVRRTEPVEVAGFASTTGTEAQNLELSQKRAENVREYLISRGVEPSLLSARGYGTQDPVASNETEGGRRANQRIELRYR